MKKYIFFLAAALLGIILLLQYSFIKKDTVVKKATHVQEKAGLLADETMYYLYTNEIVIITSNETIATDIIHRYSPCECISYHFSYFKDSDGKHPEWDIIIPIQYKDEILNTYK